MKNIDFGDNPELSVNHEAKPEASSMFDQYRGIFVKSEQASGVLTYADVPGTEQHDDEDNAPAMYTERDSESHIPGSGNLPPEARRALVSLLRMGSITANQKPKLFELICRFEKPVQAHLDDMYLRLLLDAKAGVALVLQQEATGDAEDDEIYALISRRTLSLYDTLLLLVLRKYYQDRETAGEQRIIIDIDRIEIFLTPFLTLTNNSRADKRKLSTALSKMTERKILTSVRGEEGRYEITPVIRYVVNAVFLENLLVEYQALAEASGIAEQQDQVDAGSAGELAHE